MFVVNLLIAIATFLAVFVALFGDWIRVRFFPPKLALSLRNTTGEKTTVVRQWPTSQGLKQVTYEARYYHLEVRNRRIWPRATQTQVHLLRVEQAGPDGDMQVIWAGDLPVRWTYQEAFPLMRTIGPRAYCDLCSVEKDGGIKLHPVITPNNFPPVRNEPTVLTATLQVRSSQCESSVARFQIAWDGKWEDGATEMATHLKVKNVTAKV